MKTEWAASDELIHQAESELNVTLPEELKAIWRTHNGNQLPGGWRFYPIFDPSNPRKTAGSIAHENLRGAWGIHIRSLGLLALASNGTGNHLVARVVDGHVEPKIFHWHHETERLTHWKPGIPAVMQSARKSMESLAKIRARFAPERPPPDSAARAAEVFCVERSVFQDNGRF